MRISLLLLPATLAGCNPIPIRHDCALPHFHVQQEQLVKSPTGYEWEPDRCPTKLPLRFSVKAGETLLEVRVRHEWLDLRASAAGDLLSIEGPGIREQHFEGFTHMVRADSLKDGKLNARVGDASFQVPFEMVTCTCHYYDAI